MRRALATLVLLFPLAATSALAQGTIVQEPLPELPATPSVRPSDQPVPLLPEALPPSTQRPAAQPQDRVMHLNRDPIAAGPAPGTGGAPPAETTGPGSEGARVFCEQNVTFRIAPPESVPERYRPFIGIFSDAAWTPQLCAALIVQNVQPDGTASIVYAYGPMGSNVRGAAGGVLNGTGIIQNGELRFQNSDGSQFAFKPLYSDLDGQLTTPKGQSYEAMFKRTF
jgi:hypothetical protein